MKILITLHTCVAFEYIVWKYALCDVKWQSHIFITWLTNNHEMLNACVWCHTWYLSQPSQLLYKKLTKCKISQSDCEKNCPTHSIKFYTQFFWRDKGGIRKKKMEIFYDFCHCSLFIEYCSESPQLLLHKYNIRLKLCAKRVLAVREWF